jgi:hypothetical protein
MGFVFEISVKQVEEVLGQLSRRTLDNYFSFQSQRSSLTSHYCVMSLALGASGVASWRVAGFVQCRKIEVEMAEPRE